MIRLEIRGIQEAQQANLQILAALKPSGALGRAIVYAGAEAHRRAVANTPFQTGGLAASHRVAIEAGGTRARIYIDPAAVNPAQGGKRPAEYGFHLHGQGLRPGLKRGCRAFYQYTAENDGAAILKAAADELLRGLP